MNQPPKRPANMSQLDYLWTTFGSYIVSDTLDSEYSSIPTSEAVKAAISQQVSGIVALDTAEEGDKVRVMGLDNNGKELSSILLDKDTKIESFLRHTITQEDIDNGFGNVLGENWLVLKDNKGSQYAVSIEDLIAKGQTTNTIITQAKDGKIAAELRINNPIVDRSVELTTSTSGVRADLVIDTDADSNIAIVKSDKGVSCLFTWEGTDKPVRFKSYKTYDEYLLEPFEPNTIYFIEDVKAIYFNGVKYATGEGGGGLDPTLYYTRNEVDNLLDDKVSLEGNDIIIPEGGSLKSADDVTLIKESNGIVEVGGSDIPTIINSSTRPVIKEGDTQENVAYVSDLETYTWNDVDPTKAKAMKLADIKEEYPTETLRIQYKDNVVSYDGSEEASIDLTSISKEMADLESRLEYKLSTKQNCLASGVNIKTINGRSILGNGDIWIGSDYAAIRFMGSVASYSDLPLAPNSGDIYNVVRDGVSYAWNGEQWCPYGTRTPIGLDLYKDSSGDFTGGEIRFSDNTALPINIIIQ